MTGMQNRPNLSHHDWSTIGWSEYRWVGYLNQFRTSKDDKNYICWNCDRFFNNTVANILLKSCGRYEKLLKFISTLIACLALSVLLHNIYVVFKGLNRISCYLHNCFILMSSRLLYWSKRKQICNPVKLNRGPIENPDYEPVSMW